MAGQQAKKKPGAATPGSLDTTTLEEKAMIDPTTPSAVPDDLELGTVPAPLSAEDSLFDDLDKIRVGEDFESLMQAQTAILNPPCRKPGKYEFFQVHPDPAYSIDAMLLEDEGGEFYLLPPSAAMIAAALDSAGVTVKPHRVALAVNTGGDAFLLPGKLPDLGNPLGVRWARSRLEVYDLAKGKWVRIKASKQNHQYEALVASAVYAPPKWPDPDHYPFKQLLKLSFRDNLILDFDHPVVRRLLGK